MPSRPGLTTINSGAGIRQDHRLAAWRVGCHAFCKGEGEGEAALGAWPAWVQWAGKLYLSAAPRCPVYVYARKMASEASKIYLEHVFRALLNARRIRHFPFSI